MADHVAPVFEDWCRAWLRANRGSLATQVGAWWGNSANQFRRSHERSTEEVDAVGSLRNRVTLVAECKWTNRVLTSSIVRDIDRYKVPALQDSWLRPAERLQIILFSKAGYSKGLHALAGRDHRIQLVDVPGELRMQSDGSHASSPT